MRLRRKRNPMTTWLTEEYEAATPTPLSAEQRCAQLERDMAKLERDVKRLGESVSRAHGYDEAS